MNNDFMLGVAVGILVMIAINLTINVTLVRILDWVTSRVKASKKVAAPKRYDESKKTVSPTINTTRKNP